MPKSSKTRSIDREILILAPVDAVWRAITEPVELTRWFPLEARVTPGVGGRIWMSWPSAYQFHTPIAAWTPNRHLRLMYMEPTASGQQGAAGVPLAIPDQRGVDFHLEGSSEETMLRLHHFGFSSEPAGNRHFSSAIRGWEFQLQGLKLYLERHRGTPRVCIVSRAGIPNLTASEAWSRLWSEQGLLKVTHPEPTAAGKRYAITTAPGDRLEGVVQAMSPPLDFSATVTNLNDAWMRVHVDDLPLSNRRDVNLWLSTYSLQDSRVAALQENFDHLLSTLFSLRSRRNVATRR